MKKVLVIAGARPNFMKIAPLMKEFRNNSNYFDAKLVHTGQHYDFSMSDVFFQNLDIPKPDIHLEVGSGSHASQTAKIMTAFEEVVLREKPDLVVVVGDVNSTLACSIVASKLNINVAHVEAGLRSFDRQMPEEINRLVTDTLSDFLFVSEKSGLVNLKKEGVPKGKVFFVGNVMIDTLMANSSKVAQSNILSQLVLTPQSYAVLTLHRPSNVDSKESLLRIFDILKEIAEKTQIVYPIHPRTKKMIEGFGLINQFQTLKDLKMIEPLGYIEFVRLVRDSKFVLTDSGGIQEETTVMKVPCLTMRENTERPVTITKGTNILVGTDKIGLCKNVEKICAGKPKKGAIPDLWDGNAAQRIVRILKSKL